MLANIIRTMQTSRSILTWAILVTILVIEILPRVAHSAPPILVDNDGDVIMVDVPDTDQSDLNLGLDLNL